MTPASVNAPAAHLPAWRGFAGPTMLRIQVLLDRALFSPGMMDGRWGKNTEHAVYWLQVREGLPPSGRVDSATYNRLLRLAGGPAELVRPYALTADDVAGPFTRIPSDIYEQAKLPCSCYQTLTEKLSEAFHATPEVLRKLNPGVKLDSVRAGQVLQVPAVRNPADRPGEVAVLEVSGPGNYVHALDARGRILYHFPSTLGSSYDPSPQGDFAVAQVDQDPWWHYQPKILASVPDDHADAMIPPGPNSAVGRVWVTLSVPHYGIHGTKSPETIGYAVSAGCVRLTNWDALFLSRRLRIGTPVRFRGTRLGPRTAPPAAVRRDSAGAHPATPAKPAAPPHVLGAPAPPAGSAPRKPAPPPHLLGVPVAPAASPPVKPAAAPPSGAPSATKPARRP
ncbi:MAG: murein L,D-transpeptidase [Gemmatimonadetes bacterium]|nr:murein L,D-transpeptidase [Gemmatimonadota bacterium]